MLCKEKATLEAVLSSHSGARFNPEPTARRTWKKTPKLRKFISYALTYHSEEAIDCHFQIVDHFLFLLFFVVFAISFLLVLSKKKTVHKVVDTKTTLSGVRIMFFIIVVVFFLTFICMVNGWSRIFCLLFDSTSAYPIKMNYIIIDIERNEKKLLGKCLPVLLCVCFLFLVLYGV